jgi:hypothetical protein
MGFTEKGMLGLRSVAPPFQRGVIFTAHVAENHGIY